MFKNILILLPYNIHRREKAVSFQHISVLNFKKTTKLFAAMLYRMPDGHFPSSFFRACAKDVRPTMRKKYLSKIRSPTLRATVTKLRVDSNNTKDCKFGSFRFKSFETDLREECEVNQDVKHILLYCNRGILQESSRIFTNSYKEYVPGFKNLCNDKKLKEILNVHSKYNETCIDVTTEDICKFIKNVCNAI